MFETIICKVSAATGNNVSKFEVIFYLLIILKYNLQIYIYNVNNVYYINYVYNAFKEHINI